jgi:uncharacterized coiled-coil protein SlyX
MNGEGNEAMRELEIKFAFLEKHVEAQDRAMLEHAERIAALETRLQRLHERIERGPEDQLPPEAPPPHY